MATFRDLTDKSINTLKSWQGQGEPAEWILELPIDQQFDIGWSGLGIFDPYVAEYAILYAVLIGDRDLVEDLCQHGAQLDIIGYAHDASGHTYIDKTPIQLAAEFGRAEIVRILMVHGATLPRDTPIPTSNFYSAPFTFFWTLKERMMGREVDYESIKNLVQRLDL